jgi:hypothetical protein
MKSARSTVSGRFFYTASVQVTATLGAGHSDCERSRHANKFRTHVTGTALLRAMSILRAFIPSPLGTTLMIDSASSSEKNNGGGPTRGVLMLYYIAKSERVFDFNKSSFFVGPSTRRKHILPFQICVIVNPPFPFLPLRYSIKR